MIHKSHGSWSSRFRSSWCDEYDGSATMDNTEYESDTEFNYQRRVAIRYSDLRPDGFLQQYLDYEWCEDSEMCINGVRRTKGMLLLAFCVSQHALVTLTSAMLSRSNTFTPFNKTELIAQLFNETKPGTQPSHGSFRTLNLSDISFQESLSRELTLSYIASEPDKESRR